MASPECLISLHRQHAILCAAFAVKLRIGGALAVMIPGNDKHRIDIQQCIRYYEGVGAVQKKITVMLPVELIERATRSSGQGLTPTLRRGLELVAAKAAYEKLLSLRGKFDLKLDLDELRKD